MSNDFPIWGCPWHGLIRGGELTTDAEHVIEFPQPDGFMPVDQGFTSLIALTGAPDVEHAEADEKGRQFMRKAILGAGQVHGVKLPPGAWIYESAPGVNWLVTCNLHNAQLSDSSTRFNAQITVERFGVVGEQQQRTFNFTWPDWPPSTGGFSERSVWRLAAASPVGNRAAFLAHQRFVYNHAELEYVVPIALVELTLTGQTLETIACSAEMVITPEDAVGVKSTTETINQPDVERVVVGLSIVSSAPTEGDGVVNTTDYNRSTAPRVLSVSQHRLWADHFIGACYSDEGDLQPMTVDFAEHYTYAETGFNESTTTGTEVYDEKGRFTGATPASMTSEGGGVHNSVLTITGRVAGDEWVLAELSFDINYQWQGTQTRYRSSPISTVPPSYVGGGPPIANRTETVTTSSSYMPTVTDTRVSDSGLPDRNAVINKMSSGEWWFPFALSLANADPYPMFTVPAVVRLYGDRDQGVSRGRVLASPIAPGVVCVEICRPSIPIERPQPDFLRLRSPFVLTPIGAVEVDPGPDDAPQIYGAWNPITGEAILAAEPISYT